MTEATLHEHLADARRALVDAGFSAQDAAIDAEVLARYVLGWDRATLLTRRGERASAEFFAEFDAALRRRLAREPVAYITGHREFWGLDFEVTRDVLIPRPETELIVEAALEIVERSRPARLLDVGTGSGCLAVSLATELPRARVVATDIAPAALAVAARNARRHDVAARIHFLRAHLLEPFREGFDMIVSNPPYVPSGAEISVDVAAHEPSAALYAGEDGLDALRALIGGAAAHLLEDGALVVEFGFGQAESVSALARAAGWRVDVRRDLQGIPRVAVMRR